MKQQSRNAHVSPRLESSLSDVPHEIIVRYKLEQFLLFFLCSKHDSSIATQPSCHHAGIKLVLTRLEFAMQEYTSVVLRVCHFQTQ